MKRLLALATLFLSLATAPLLAQSLPEICKRKNCFMTFDGVERGFCQAYVEGKSCFMSLDGEDRGWCQHLREGKSCFMALDGEARKDCEANRIPREHRHWMRMCSYW
ncbi:hypothetical protein [Ancylobacter sp. FA202]|uniref:hypothetical protein n=1 Tax=Ancylobacter sp. FA202 TaxID=1111106 RepID=UPI00036501AE|nr:hypothetical protein [Ancylobacter sp. FA202]